MRFNLDRFIGIIAIGVAAFLLMLMHHIDPMGFFYYLQNPPNSSLIQAYAIFLVIAAVFLSTESHRKGSQ